jgi:hypothetical protein
LSGERVLVGSEHPEELDNASLLGNSRGSGHEKGGSRRSLRGSANRDGLRMKIGHEIFHHPGSSLSFPSKKEHTHARHPTIHHRAHLPTTLAIVATNANRSPSRLPSVPHSGSSGLREARASACVRLRLRKNRPRVMFSATTLRRRRDEWIEAGSMETLEDLALESYDRIIGLELLEVAIDCCIQRRHPMEARKRVKAQWTGENRASNAL